MTIDEYKKQFLALYMQLAEEHGACSGVYIAPGEELYGVSRISIEIRF